MARPFPRAAVLLSLLACLPADAGAPRTRAELDCRKAFAQPMVLWPADRKLIPVEIRNVTAGPGDEVRIAIRSVRQNEPPQAAGAQGGRHSRLESCPDAVVGPARLELRAERLGEEGGRIYLIVFDATSSRGATCSGEVVVRVPRVKGRKDEAQPTRRDATYDSTRCD